MCLSVGTTVVQNDLGGPWGANSDSLAKIWLNLVGIWWRFWPKTVKKNFGGHFGGFPYWIGKNEWNEKVTYDLRRCDKKNYFMTFIPKSHILAKKVDFLTFFTHFGHFEGLPD